MARRLRFLYVVPRRITDCVLHVNPHMGTWNSLGQQLSETKILDAVQELARNKIQVTNLIIDDSWQSLDLAGSDRSQLGWTEFEADRKAFPSGLRNVVAQIRNLHPGIENVIVWHALLGYWGGISPNGHIAKTYDTIKVAQEGEDGASLTVVDKADVSRLYNDFYRFLAESGIDGVKADAQVMVDGLRDAPDRRDLISTYLDVWSQASERYFGAKAISCMSQFPYSLFCHLHRTRSVFFVRNSDDFFPDIPQSYSWHVWANAHNVILTQFLNAIPDWDMFQSAHNYSEFHAAARCISGGPIYITDTPGVHNMHLIKQMTATTPIGQTVILRPSVLGKSIYAYAGYEDDLLLKIGSYNGAAQTGTGILGVFNVSRGHLTEVLPLAFFRGVFQGGKYAVRAHTTGQTSAPMSLGAAESVIAVSIDETAYEILWACPVTPFTSDRCDHGYAGVLGLVGKMTGCAAVTFRSVVQRDSGRVVVTCNIKAVGTLGLYISTLPYLNIEDDFMVAVEDQPVPLDTVRRSRDDKRVFEIDVEKAWKEMAVSTMQRGKVQIKASFQP
ncbi:raffinose synthase Sip1 [Metarhizium album ARSEF 1941]|uniref:Raffinose synthase Sip1 n=1 Tax=Metarhizium album (strain ARSEF 1941) TaxID=1081103 RepID=A0A0B2WTH4_METAS|nr:raffinose synthase Sip1 [Metarhizium album ARSEF 1941]KHN96752.1 raffinose synthase Sip1 [Metarhizium album ARSEF 1941]